MKPTLQTALKLREAGLSCIPCKLDKRPAFAWKRFQKERPSEDELIRFFSNGASIALVAGKVQCLDFDEKYRPGIYEDFCFCARENGLGELLDRLLVQKTPSGGFHLVFRCSNPSRSEKLANNPRHESLIETRGEGGYFLIAPSHGYELLQGSWESIPEITEEDCSDLWSLARSFDQTPPQEPRGLPALGNEVTPGDDYDEKGALFGLLRSHGWSACDSEGNYWTRPGKTRGISASWNQIPRRFWVFSTSTPFEPHHVYRPWHVYAFLEHDGDFQAAARELKRKGYGPGIQPRHTHESLQRAREAVDSKGAGGGPCALEFPPILAWSKEEKSAMQKPSELIKGVLLFGAKAMLGAPSKGRKTYTLIDLAVSVAEGVPWLGFPTTQAPVLYLNFEMQDFDFRKRRREIQEAKFGKRENLPHYYVWHLRGYSRNWLQIRERVIDFCREKSIGLILVDPVYKLNFGGDENSARDISKLLDDFERLARDTQAAVFWSHHFTKGSPNEKEAIDRVSGSGVWGRDPDTIITFTPHEEEDCMAVDMVLRNFARVEAFAIRWDYPLWHRALDLDPRALKERNKTGRPQGNKFDSEDLKAVLESLQESNVNRQNIEQIVKFTGVSPATVWRRWGELQSL